jgi:hypothetical protein
MNTGDAGLSTHPIDALIVIGKTKRMPLCGVVEAMG